MKNDIKMDTVSPCSVLLSCFAMILCDMAFDVAELSCYATALLNLNFSESDQSSFSCSLFGFTSTLQERIPHHSNSHFCRRFPECLCPKLLFFDNFSLFGWSWLGRRSCTRILVSRVHSCSKQRLLDGYLSNLLDCWYNLRSWNCMGMLIA